MASKTTNKERLSSDPRSRRADPAYFVDPGRPLTDVPPHGGSP